MAEVLGRRATVIVVGVVGVACWSLVGWEMSLRVRHGVPLDFQVYRDAVRDLYRGGSPYRTSFTHVRLDFTYPPFALLVLSPLGLIDSLVGLSLWSLVGVVALGSVVYFGLRDATTLSREMSVAAASAITAVSCLVLEPVRSSLYFGQINFILMGAIVYDLTRAASRSRGVLTGLCAAIKLTPLIYLAYFALARQRSSWVRGGAAFVGAAVIAWCALPGESHTFWLRQAFSPGRKGRTAQPINQSWFSLSGHLASHSEIGRLALWTALCALTLWVCAVLAGRYVRADRSIDAIFVLALGEVLVSPISWAHHWSWIVLVPVLLLARWHYAAANAAMIVLLVVAVIQPYRWRWDSWYARGVGHDLVGWSLLWAGATLLAVLFVESRRPLSSSPEHPSAIAVGAEK